MEDAGVFGPTRQSPIRTCATPTGPACRALDDAIVWVCPACRTEGRISDSQGSLWDLRYRPLNCG